jgi:hypothetical protein
LSVMSTALLAERASRAAPHRHRGGSCYRAAWCGCTEPT